MLVRDGRQIGLGRGQTSRVDAARQAVEKARAFSATRRAAARSPASDAFFPFADGPQVLLEAGVTAIVQPGGSLRDREVIAVADAAGAAMLLHRHPPLPSLTSRGTGSWRPITNTSDSGAACR